MCTKGVLVSVIRIVSRLISSAGGVAMTQHIYGRLGSQKD
jgi:hypothetical protein